MQIVRCMIEVLGHCAFSYFNEKNSTMLTKYGVKSLFMNAVADENTVIIFGLFKNILRFFYNLRIRCHHIKKIFDNIFRFDLILQIYVDVYFI